MVEQEEGDTAYEDEPESDDENADGAPQPEPADGEDETAP
jgi:hypothetical protein